MEDQLAGNTPRPASAPNQRAGRITSVSTGHLSRETVSSDSAPDGHALVHAAAITCQAHNFDAVIESGGEAFIVALLNRAAQGDGVAGFRDCRRVSGRGTKQEGDR